MRRALTRGDGALRSPASFSTRRYGSFGADPYGSTGRGFESCPRRMRRLVSFAIVAVLALAACGGDDDESSASPMTTTTAPSTSTTFAAATAKCDPVAFTPNSEDGAGEIQATGLSCDEAEEFVRTGAGPRTSSGGPPELDAQGYHCVMTEQREDPLPQAFYECTRSEEHTS